MGKSLSLPATTRETERWLTPRWILDPLGRFDLDPCGAPGWPTADEIYTPETHGDGLSLPWSGRVWMNPPYGTVMGAWLERMADHGKGIALIFARTDTAAFHEFVWPHADALLFIRGRLTFLRPDLSAPIANSGAPSVLLAYGHDDADLLRTCGIPGHYIDQRRLRNA
jgi:hypothetical protein